MRWGHRALLLIVITKFCGSGEVVSYLELGGRGELKWL